LFLSAVTIGELRQGVETVRHRGDVAQATRLTRWLGTVIRDYADAILPFDEEIALRADRRRRPESLHVNEDDANRFGRRGFWLRGEEHSNNVSEKRDRLKPT
jgi:predicted nucleic acid-binding protein